MAHDAPMEIASLLQSASINRHPSPKHDMNPSTSVSSKQPVRLASHPDPDSASDAAEDEIPLSVLRPLPRKSTMPPLPDLRFEQSYLKRIENVKSWQEVAWITFKDHVLMCFVQGVGWTLMLNGWRYLNRSSKFSGRSVGARIRRWWWGVNNWSIPTEKPFSRLRNQKLAGNASEYYQNQFSSG